MSHKFLFEFGIHAALVLRVRVRQGKYLRTTKFCLRLEGSVHHVGINVFLRNRVSCKSIHRDAKKARVMAAQIIKES